MIAAASFASTVAALALAQGELPPDELLGIQFDPDRESVHYRLVDVPIPAHLWLEASSMRELPDGRLAIGTRRGDVFLVEGADLDPPRPEFRLFATGLTEVFGLAFRDGDLFATQQCEVTRLVDRDSDGVADRYETVAAAFGYGAEHEFAFGSDFDRDGNIFVALCLSGSYTSDNPLRGFCLRVGPDGRTEAWCSGLRSPGGVGFDAEGEPFYTENQGPWNGACSLKHLTRGGFMGHPASLRWFDEIKALGPRPTDPRDGPDVRLYTEEERIDELVPYAVVFPYKRMGQSASAILCDRSEGRFGPFAGQLFVADYTLSLVMRVALERIDGVYQGACFPFREGFSTGLIGACLTRSGQLFAGGSNRGWPARGSRQYSLERLDYTGRLPFEIATIAIQPDGFELTFTAPVDPKTASDPSSYRLRRFTHHYHKHYGSPEIDADEPAPEGIEVSADDRRVTLRFAPKRGYVHEFHLPGVRSAGGEPLLHDAAYYTVNRVPR